MWLASALATSNTRLVSHMLLSSTGCVDGNENYVGEICRMLNISCETDPFQLYGAIIQETVKVGLINRVNPF